MFEREEVKGSGGSGGREDREEVRGRFLPHDQ